ncbi:MAG TPA: 1-(5-phosphoribosyl)-5-[(5-phosphoribosylamino)methylideneamino]imidazole-4-carboxamide isomerase [Chryseolinea sp.]|nr:1-(5-phosphoribosyl)-5-[(5-phosphoribosylamino)methylideneamino]imidazole-4-carboxamide isomerase [Chryseolinea sp.]HPH46368.1 1-(5-phosphoribosyl)-5-[(5-phosphoribosylamino)methylideneamino]imidazole-4-carboxamide isomerase [Chryseolinea sp.]HPM32528.1 1-(5-phosphoribosyl)-5-[(5-phosphoribosylamino)methylideneamino]imidazole-4-carboxamide isomerase [Chryseolinea sp.]
MRIIPAIDIIDGKCVRLTQGDYAQKKIYSKYPLDVAKEFEDADLKYIHLVDLDGAKKGKVVNWKVIEDIHGKTSLKVDFGGGVKTADEVERLLELDINQINIGSMAVKDPDTFISWMQKYHPENFILSADVRDEKIMINGWQDHTELDLYEFVGKFVKEGLTYLTCTDISTDGMLQGPNFGLYKKLKKRFPDLKIIASGGVSNIDDVKELKYIKVDGVIIGKAYYEGKVTLKELKDVD